MSTQRITRGHLPPLSAPGITPFTEVDHLDHEAQIALIQSGEIVGVTRYIRLAADSDKAEVAVTVADGGSTEGLATRSSSV